MHHRQIHESDGQRTFVIIFDIGDEVMHGLQEFAQSQHLAASQFTAR